MIDSKNATLPAGQICPFFQPILSLQSMSVIGHESLGREIVGGEVRSLGAFFHDPAIPEPIQIATDRKLRQIAFAKAVREGYGGLLFVNLKPSWIYRSYRETGRLPTLELLTQYGLPAGRVVVEITEESFSGKLKELLEIVDIYRQHGCLLAVDDVGSGFSSLDRIAMFRPDIIKMDLKILRKGVTHDGYRALLRSFSIIAEQMGGSLLVEGVENVLDLKNAMAAGARYVQGYLFSEAKRDFLPEHEYTALLNEQMDRYGKESYASYLKLMAAEHRLKELADRTAVMAAVREPDHLAGELIHEVPENTLRIYLCRGDGIQVSCNFERGEDGAWTRNEEYRGSNWLWRPYFIPTIIHMQKQRSGILSQAYADLATAKPIQSYSCPVGTDLYLFVDLLIR
ncbi:EAL domain-containing protein [Paenibacillus sp. YN15]|uniref:EAL domain-containing protein n=1 Tax=Paenibacillus sp. YN15 TaxID=1742774 RepID=UPI000DCBC239|nr:EAL domain-containing protein [Paenibacillus sp. YN15]RAU94925.1 diguanylate phosphodiesterase [Paenibacillus sp. YN15]